MAIDISKLSRRDQHKAAAYIAARKSPAVLATLLFPGYKIRDTHRYIGDHLARLNNTSWEQKKLMIFAPPQVGKSQLVSQTFPIWWLMHHPSHQVVAAAYGQNLARKWGRAVRNIVKAKGQPLGLELAGDNRSAQEWQISGGGGMRTTSVGSALTGHSANLLICDDPHKSREDYESKLSRDRVWDWWTSVFLTRQAPGTPICLIMTRWGDDDLAGRLLDREADEWTVLRLPAFADTTTDPLGRRIGDPLPHHTITDYDRTVEWWNKQRKGVGTRDWHSMYMADPQPAEGTLLTPAQMDASLLPDTFTPPGVVKAAVAVDPSGTQGGDEAGIVAGYLGEDDRVYITRDATRQYSPTEWAAEAIRLAIDTFANTIYIETNFGGEMCKSQLLSAWADMEEDGYIPEGTLIPEIKEVRAKHGKRIRAEPTAQKWTEGCIKLYPHGMDQLIREWTTWQTGSRLSPGRIDASVYLVTGLIGTKTRTEPSTIHTPYDDLDENGNPRHGHPDACACEDDDDMTGHDPTWWGHTSADALYTPWTR